MPLLALAALATAHAQSPPAPSPAASAPEAATEQDAQSIIITGTKRNQTAQRTAESVAVKTAEQIEQRGIESLNQALDRTANVVKQGFGVSIRGFTTSTASDQIRRPSIALVRDGVENDIIGFSTLDSLWDAEQLEVLRGSQSTAYGRSAIGGAIVLNTRNPDFVPEFEARLGTGADGWRAASGVVSGPLIDGLLAGRLAVDYQSLQPQIPEFFFGSQRSDQTVVRGKLLLQPAGSAWRVLGTVQLTDGGLGRQEASATFPLTPDRTSDPRLVSTSRSQGSGFGDTQLLDGSLRLNAQLGAGWSGELLLSAYDRDQQTRIDEILCVDASNPFEPLPLDPADCLRFDNDFSGNNRTTEVRLSWQQGPWTALLGGFAQRSRTTFRYFDKPFDGSTRLFDTEENFRVRSSAVFGEVGRSFGPDWKVAVRARYNRERSSLDSFDHFTGITTPGADGRSNKLTPELVVSHDLMPTLTLHGALKRGFRAGGAEFANGVTDLNDRENTRVSLALPFGPEVTDSAELGARWLTAERTLSVNANAYFTNYKDRQVPVIARDAQGNIIYVVDPSFEDFFFEAGAIANAARSRSRGLEVELNWRPLRVLELYGGLGLQRGWYVDFPQEDGSNLAGQRFRDFPSRTANAGFVWRAGLGWQLALGAQHVGPTEGDGIDLPAQTTWNGRVAYDAEAWSIALTGDNLTDRRYLLSRFGDADTPGVQHNYNSQRVWRLQARVRF